MSCIASTMTASAKEVEANFMLLDTSRTVGVKFGVTASPSTSTFIPVPIPRNSSIFRVRSVSPSADTGNLPHLRLSDRCRPRQ